MVCIMLAAFVICWVPLQVVVLYSQFFHSTQDGEVSNTNMDLQVCCGVTAAVDCRRPLTAEACYLTP